MIKVQNNIATREALPAFLQGLQNESLADLSWTDPALGVSDCKWLPEVEMSPALGVHERYEGETLTVVGDVVHVTRTVVPWSAGEIEAERKAAVPKQVTMRQARLALLGAGLLSSVNAAIASLPSPQKEAAQIEWEYAAVVDRNAGLVPAMGSALGMTEVQLDDLFIAAGAL